MNRTIKISETILEISYTDEMCTVYITGIFNQTIILYPHFKHYTLRRSYDKGIYTLLSYSIVHLSSNSPNYIKFPIRPLFNKLPLSKQCKNFP